MTKPDEKEMSTDIAVPVREMTRIPNISSEQYSHLGKYSGALVMAAFEMIGGLPRLAAWAETNPTDFYTKIWNKTIQRSQQVDVTGTLTIDDAITRLERQGEVFEAEFEDITNYDL